MFVFISFIARDVAQSRARENGVVTRPLACRARTHARTVVHHSIRSQELPLEGARTSCNIFGAVSFTLSNKERSVAPTKKPAKKAAAKKPAAKKKAAKKPAAKKAKK